MKKEDKAIIIEQIKEAIQSYAHFYLTEAAGLNAGQVADLRRQCNKQDIKMLVVKNTLLKKALESFDTDFSAIFPSLVNNTAILFTNTGNAPAKLIKTFAKEAKKPVLKAAYVEECFYIGENQLDALQSVKSKNELLGELVGMLQSPMQNLVGQLQSGGNSIHGVLKTLESR